MSNHDESSMPQAAEGQARELTAAALFSSVDHSAASDVLLSVRCRLGPISDLVNELLPEERCAIERAVPKRQREFATGRVFARQLLHGLLDGSDALPIALPAAPDRSPRWPTAVAGSISHSDRLVWVAVAPRSAGVRGLGIDVERRHRLPRELHDKLFVESERAAIAAGPDDFPTWLFTAKEAIYKATRPLAGAFIGFTEAECTMDAGGSFTVRYLGNHDPSAIMEQGRGYVMQDDDHVFALFMIDR